MANLEQMLKTRAEIDRDYPEIPDGFWPDEVRVVGKFGNLEFSFLIIEKTFVGEKFEQTVIQCLMALRNSLWQKAKWKRMQDEKEPA